MEIAVALEFLSGHHRTVLVTRRRDGSLQMSPVSSGVVDGKLVVSTRSALAKVANLRRDPTASVLVMSDEFFGSWVQADGRAEIIEQPDALPLLEDVYRSIAGEHPDWAEYRQAMINDGRVVISLTVERASGRL